MFCMSLNKAENRKRFKDNESAYLDGFALDAEQRRTVLERDWLGMLRVGGNIYYTIKIAFCDGLTFQDVAGMMSGMTKETYGQMMLAGGRSPDGNRYKNDATAQEKPVAKIVAGIACSHVPAIGVSMDRGTTGTPIGSRCSRL